MPGLGAVSKWKNEGAVQTKRTTSFVHGMLGYAVRWGARCWARRIGHRLRQVSEEQPRGKQAHKSVPDMRIPAAALRIKRAIWSRRESFKRVLSLTRCTFRLGAEKLSVVMATGCSVFYFANLVQQSWLRPNAQKTSCTTVSQDSYRTSSSCTSKWMKPQLNIRELSNRSASNLWMLRVFVLTTTERYFLHKKESVPKG